MNKLRYLIAFITAKLSVIALRLTGHPGTNLPGQLALRICPDFLPRFMMFQQKNVMNVQRSVPKIPQLMK